jgi:hypothetical protein
MLRSYSHVGLEYVKFMGDEPELLHGGVNVDD